MNIFAKNKDFNDDGIFSIHEFATELDEDTLRTKVNGGGCDGSGPKGSGAAQTSSGGNMGNGSGGAGGNGSSSLTGSTPTTNPGTSSDGKDKPQSGNNDFSHSSGSFQDSGIPEEYLLAQEKALADLAGIKEIEYKGKNLIVINYDEFINNPKAFENAANFHLFTGKYGTAGNKKTDGIAILDKNMQVIHIFSDDKAIVSCRDRICQKDGKTFWGMIEGVSDVSGKVGDSLGLLSTVTESIDVKSERILDKLEVFADKAGKASKALGIITGLLDLGECIGDPSFDNAFNLAMDGITFIPIYGPAISTGLTLTKEVCEVLGEKTQELAEGMLELKKDGLIAHSTASIYNDTLLNFFEISPALSEKTSNLSRILSGPTSIESATSLNNAVTLLPFPTKSEVLLTIFCHELRIVGPVVGHNLSLQLAIALSSLKICITCIFLSNIAIPSVFLLPAVPYLPVKR